MHCGPHQNFGEAMAPVAAPPSPMQQMIIGNTVRLITFLVKYLPYTPWVKKQVTLLMLILREILIDFQRTWTHVHVHYMTSSVRLSVVCLSVTFVHSTQPTEIFGNVSAPRNTLVTWRHPGKILRRSSKGNPSVGGLNQRVLEKM